MARVVGEANPVPFSEWTFLTQKDLANHTGIGISCIRKKSWIDYYRYRLGCRIVDKWTVWRPWNC